MLAKPRSPPDPYTQPPRKKGPTVWIVWSAYAYALSVLRVGLVHVGVTEKSYHAANQATGKAEIEAGKKKIILISFFSFRFSS